MIAISSLGILTLVVSGNSTNPNVLKISQLLFNYFQIKLENQALQDTANQDWFLYGGILALVGVILGFILPKLSWRRKNSWDLY